MKFKPAQPKIEKGRTFTGWATFNWGICHQNVHRTRKAAKEALLSREKKGTTWDDIKSHMMIVKVECKVI